MARILCAAACAALLCLGCEAEEMDADTRSAPTGLTAEPPAAIQLGYLEIVTPEVDSVCAAYAKTYGVTFSQPIAELGGARTASLPKGGRVGVRAPLRETEQPIVRPYVLVADIATAVKAAEAAGATIAHPPLKLPGQGTFAIYILGGVEHGLWQR